MRRISLIIFLFIWQGCLYAQEDFFSRLPIVIINTDIDAVTGQPLPITDEPKVSASMKIIYVNEETGNCLADSTNPDRLQYDGRIAIEIRGTTSQLTEKKSYGFETRLADGVSNNNVSLFGMPKEHDWILNGFYYEDSYLRDPLTYTLGRRTGHYAPRTHYCELFLNGTYQGLYLFSEKIKRDKNRVNIKKMDDDDNAEPAVTGGYIFKADRVMSNDSLAWVTISYDDSYSVSYVYHTPKPADITPEQCTYLHDYFFAFMDAVDVDDTSEVSGYPSYIDVPSFIDYMIVSELGSNVDAYQYSTFFHKDRQQKLCAGPLWDFNFAYGNDHTGRSGYDVWQFDNGTNTGSPFWKQLFESPYFHRRLVARWYELTIDGPLAYDTVMALIDSLEAAHYDAVPRDKARWPHLVADYDYHMWIMRQWISDRYEWINKQFQEDAEELTVEPQLSPNPTNGILNLVGIAKGDNVELVEVYDMQGSLVIRRTVDESTSVIDISSLPADIYITRTVIDGKSVYQKIVKL